MIVSLLGLDFKLLCLYNQKCFRTSMKHEMFFNLFFKLGIWFLKQKIYLKQSRIFLVQSVSSWISSHFYHVSRSLK